MTKLEAIVDWLMLDYVGSIPEGIVRQWTREIVARDYQQFLKEYNERK
jgi:hypothetical protein